MKKKNRPGAGRPYKSYKYVGPISHKNVPIHEYKKEKTFLKKQNRLIEDTTQHETNKLQSLIKIRDSVEELISIELESLAVMDKKGVKQKVRHYKA